jgi:uncharacterized protein YjaG (DUF416 family)
LIAQVWNHWFPSGMDEPIAVLKTRLAVLATSHGFQVEEFEEVGLGIMRGLSCRIHSGRVYGLVEAVALQNSEYTGPEVVADHCEYIALGPDLLVRELLDALGLSADDVVWMQSPYTPGEGEATAFGIAELTRNLGERPPSARIAFAAACAERLLPHYAAFAAETGWGDPALLRRALDRAWDFAAGADVPLEELQALRLAADDATPDTEDFTTALVSPALDAANAVWYAVGCCIAADPGQAAEAGRCATATVDIYVQEREEMEPGDPDLEQRIASHPLMLAELERQRLDLLSLAGARVSRPDFMAGFRARAAATGSNIGLVPP